MSPFVTAPWASPLGCQRTLIAAPTEEPLTLDEGKLRAGLDWPAGDPRDALMLDFIKSARAKVEQDTSLALLTQSWDITIEAGFVGVVPLPSQTQPTQSIAEATGLLPRSRYQLRDRWLRVDTPGTWDVEAFTFHVVSGWPSVAALKEEAPGLVHAVGLLTAHYATLGRDLATAGQMGSATEIPFGYADAIDPYRLIWVM